MKARQLLSQLGFNEAIALARQGGEKIDEVTFKPWWDASQVAKAARPDRWSAPIESDIAPGCEAYVAEVTAIPQIAMLGTRPWAIKVVDLRHVVGFQLHVKEERISVPAGVADDPCALLRYSLRKPAPGKVAMIAGPFENQVTITAPDTNLQVVGQMNADHPLGKVLGFIIGGGIPWIQVVAFQGRHVLRDGYHRAIGLLRNGIFEVPVARIEGAQVADLGLRPGFLPADVVLGAQPPLLTDFLDDALSRNGQMHRESKVVRIAADQFVVPFLGDDAKKTAGENGGAA
jgi:hypothetical protein